MMEDYKKKWIINKGMNQKSILSKILLSNRDVVVLGKGKRKFYKFFEFDVSWHKMKIWYFLKAMGKIFFKLDEKL